MARDTRQALIDAAHAELLEKGWHGTSGEGIRLRAKASKGSWAYHFPKGKQEVAVALYPKLRADLWTRWIDSVVGPPSEANIRRAFEALVYAVRSDLARWRVLLELEDALTWLRGDDFLAASQSAAAYDRSAIAKIWTAVPKGRRRSEGLASDEVAVLYLLVLTPIREAVRRWLQGLEPKPSDALLVAMTRHAVLAWPAIAASKEPTKKAPTELQQSTPNLF